MRDTPASVDRAYREMLMSWSNAERFLAGCSMFETARAFVVASEREKNAAASPAALRVALFLRTYGGDFRRTSVRGSRPDSARTARSPRRERGARGIGQLERATSSRTKQVMWCSTLGAAARLPAFTRGMP